MDQFLINIEKYKYAIIGTIFFHVLFFVISSFTSVQPVKRMPPQEVSIEIPLDDIELEPEIEKLLELNKEPLPSQNIANIAADANDTREKAYENYSTNKDEVDQDVSESVKDFEAQLFKDAADQSAKDLASQTNSHVKIETKSHTINTNKHSSVSSGGKNAFAGKVMISYNLIGRKAYNLPNPGYTCNNSGTIVIQIKVDKNGTVKDSKFMSGLSTSSNECLVKRAIRYANKSRFDFKEGGMQTGSITYEFKGQ